MLKVGKEEWEVKTRKRGRDRVKTTGKAKCVPRYKKSRAKAVPEGMECLRARYLPRIRHLQTLRHKLAQTTIQQPRSQNPHRLAIQFTYSHNGDLVFAQITVLLKAGGGVDGGEEGWFGCVDVIRKSDFCSLALGFEVLIWRLNRRGKGT